MKYAVLVTLVACGSGSNTPVDSKMIDSAAATKVVTVDCATNTATATVMTVNGTDAYMPMSTPIAVNQVVKFITSSEHDVNPNPIGNSDPGLKVGFSLTKCLKFTQAGTFGFYCSNHSFAGTIVVN